METVRNEGREEEVITGCGMMGEEERQKNEGKIRDMEKKMRRKCD